MLKKRLSDVKEDSQREHGKRILVVRTLCYVEQQKQHRSITKKQERSSQVNERTDGYYWIARGS